MKKMKQLLAFALLLLGAAGSYTGHAQGDAVFDWVVAGTRDSGIHYNSANDVAVDNLGNAYHVGTLIDTVNWGGVKLVSKFSPYFANYPSDVLISKFDAAGNLSWVKHFGVRAFGESIALDNKGHIYVAGQFSDSLQIDAFTFLINNAWGPTPNTDGFVMKMDTAGNVIWVKQLHSNQAQGDIRTQTSINMSDINTDTAGNAYITGYYRGAINIDTFHLSQKAPYGNDDAFMAKLDANGNCQWITGIRGFKNNSSLRGRSIAADLSGSVYCYGQMPDSALIDNTIFGSGVENIVSNYVLKLNGDNGKMEWVKVLGKEMVMLMGGVFPWYPVAPDGGRMALDHLGHIIITNSFYGKVDFNLSDNPADTFYMIPAVDNINYFPESTFVLKLDTTGAFVWAKAFQLRGNGFSRGIDIATDRHGNVFTTGLFGVSGLLPGGGAVDFDPGQDTLMLSRSTDHPGAFVAELDPKGNLKWVRVYGGIGDNDASDPALPKAIGVSCDGQNIYTTGTYTGTVDFNTGKDSFIVSTGLKYDVYEAMYLHKLVDTASVENASSTIDTATDCNGFTINGETFTTAGRHYTTFRHWSGCDSVVTINLTLILPEPVISVDVDTLSTTQSYVSYQWLFNGGIIPGATNRKYTVSKNGDYRVIVTDKSGCFDTSAVYKVTNQDGINGHAGQTIRIYPNPTTDMVYIESTMAVDVVLTGIDGKRLIVANGAKQISMKQLAAGVYFLHVHDREGNPLRVEKIVKQ